MRDESGRGGDKPQPAVDGDIRGMLEEACWRERNSALGCVIGGIAHEMNNIFGRILGFAELAIEDDVPEETRQFLAEVRDSTVQATKLSKWLGRFSRRRRVSVEKVEPAGLLDDAVLTVRPELKAEQVSLDLRKPGASGEGCKVSGDPVLLAQAVVQMMLVRLSAGDGITTMTLELRLDEACNRCTIEVWADGAPPKGDELRRRLEGPTSDRSRESLRFEQVLRSLDLLLAKAIAQFHGGGLEVSGDRIRLWLPLAEAE